MCRTLLLAAAIVAATSSCAWGATLSFTGAFSRDWNTAANWTSAGDPAVHAVPTALDDVHIPFGATPTLAAGPAGAGRLIALDAGASLTVSGRALTVAGGSPSTFAGALTLTDGGSAALLGGGVHSGSFAIAAGTVLAVDGDHALDVGASVTGEGTLQLDGGTFKVPAGADAFAPGTLLLSGGFLDLAKISTVGRLTSDGEGGGRRGVATLFAGGPTLLENVTLDSGATTLSGAAITLRRLGLHGTTLNLQPGTHSLWDSGSWELLGSTVNNFGDVVITGDGRAAVIGDGAFFNNRAGGSMTRDDADPSAGTVSFTTGVKNDGRISIVAGELELAGTSEPSGGTFAIGARGTLSVATAYVLERGGAVTGDGTLRLDAGALSVPPGGGRFDPATVVFSGGFLSLGRDATVGRLTSDGEGGGRTGGTATLNAGGPTLLDEVLLFGPGTTNLLGPEVTLRDLTAAGGSRLSLAPGTKAVWDAGNWRLGETLLTAAGELRITGDGTAADTGGLPLVHNTGTVVREDAEPVGGVASFAAQLRNSGVLHVARGALDLGGLGEQDAGLTTVDAGTVLGAADARYTLTGGRLEGTGAVAGTLENAGGTVAPGASPGVLTVDGAYVQGAAGTLEAEIAQAASPYDQLVVRGSASLDGTLGILTQAGADAAPGAVFDVVTSGTSSGRFATVTGTDAGARHYDVEYSAEPGRVRLRVPGVVAQPPQGGVPALPASAHSGERVVCDPGTWSGEPTGFAFTWLRDGAPIAGESAAAYTLTDADVDQTIRCQVIATNGGGHSAPAASNALVPVEAPPTTLAPPSIPAIAQAGDVLHCDVGRWSGQPLFAIAWLRDATPVASGADYTVTAADVGHPLRCRVAASNRGGAVSVDSAPVTPSSPPPPPPPPAGAPANLVAPAISGNPTRGRILRCNRGTWTGKPRFAYRWLRDGKPIEDATNPTYRVRERDVRRLIACRVRARNASGLTRATSDAVLVRDVRDH